MPKFILRCAGKGIAQACTFYVSNKCPFSIWPATASNTGHPVLANDDSYLAPGSTRKIQVPGDWLGRIWARTDCNFDSNNNRLQSCETGDCTGKLECNGATGLPPTTLVLFTIQADKKQPNFYDVSLVDEYNLPVSVSAKPEPSKCHIGWCWKNMKNLCPAELQVTNQKGEVVACFSGVRSGVGCQGRRRVF